MYAHVNKWTTKKLLLTKRERQIGVTID
jgi:hypothetical protein